MGKRQLLTLFLLVLLPTVVFSAIEVEEARIFVGQDLHLRGGELISERVSTGDHIIVFQGGFSMSIGANQFSSDSAVVWLGIQKAEVYLAGDVLVKKGKSARTVDLSERVVEEGRSMVVWFGVSGEVFVTAETMEIGDTRGLELYKKAFSALRAIETVPEFVVQREAMLPELPVEKVLPEKRPEEVVTVKVERVFAPEKKPVRPAEVLARPEERKPIFRYPVNIAPAGEVAPKIERTKVPDGTDIATVIGRFYLWQKQDESGGLLELMADNAVVFSSLEKEETQNDIPAGGAFKAIYMCGDVVYTCGQRTIRSDEMYYDFEEKKAIAVNAVMRNFDAGRGIPIYVRAAELRQLAENKFAADDITLTSSEFYLPQVSLNASSVIITDTTSVDERGGRVSDSSYDAQMRDVRLKMKDGTIFYWPFMRSNLQRPDVPLKSAHIGYDSDWGATVETRWYLSRLLGLREPEGTDSTLALDYYGRRGVGGGVEIDYARDDYYGRVLGYVIRDTGEDDLGRHSSRRDLKPPRELRGRFFWRHRHFLPYNWQLTSEVSYASDEHFIEGYYRSEFDVGKEQETLIHLKRIEDNWGLSILGKWRINNFVDKLEELPTVEYHLTGQSLFDDKFTFYSDGQVGRFRQRSASESSTQEFFTFIYERAELDMPMTIGVAKVVPFVAGTLGFEDGSGFRTDIGGSTAEREDKVWLGEAGARVSLQPYWKVYPDVKSRLWGLSQLRHIVSPHLMVAGYTGSDSVIEQRDALNVGVSQRLQTRRGSGSNRRTIDWMRLDMDVTWVRDSGDASAGPDRFIWNKPFIPLEKRRSSDIFGPRRNYFSADYIWRLSDTTAVLSDMNFDMQSGVVQQFNVGFSHLRWPNLQFYVGSRYLRRIDNSYGEHGSNAFTFAASYILDPRYTVVFSQQFDFDYGAVLRSDIALIRRYHRVCWGFTYSADESLDKQAIVFSIWPQGVEELAIGQRRYMGLGGSAGF